MALYSPPSVLHDDAEVVGGRLDRVDETDGPNVVTITVLEESPPCSSSPDCSCPICFLPLHHACFGVDAVPSSIIVTTDCNHHFCKSCLYECAQRSEKCPLCRCVVHSCQARDNSCSLCIAHIPTAKEILERTPAPANGSGQLTNANIFCWKLFVWYVMVSVSLMVMRDHSFWWGLSMLVGFAMFWTCCTSFAMPVLR